MTITDSAPTAHHGLAILRTALQALEQGAMNAHAFSELARAQAALLAALPPRYGQVLHDLLDRLEAGALFTEESCSFSQRDLMGHLHGWLEKAEGQLARP